MFTVYIFRRTRAQKTDRGERAYEEGERKKRRNVNHGLFLWRMKTDVKK